MAKAAGDKKQKIRTLYIIASPNPQYEGVTFGVKFHKGIGRTDKKEIRDELVKNFKYKDVTAQWKKEHPELFVMPEEEDKA